MDVQMFALWKAKWFSSFVVVVVVIWPCFECVFWASCITAMWQFLVGSNTKNLQRVANNNNINNNNGNDNDDDDYDDQRNSLKLQLAKLVAAPRSRLRKCPWTLHQVVGRFVCCCCCFFFFLFACFSLGCTVRINKVEWKLLTCISFLFIAYRFYKFPSHVL